MITRCGYCKRVMFVWPWTHFAFYVTEEGTDRYHVKCFQEMNLDLTYRETQRQYSYEDFLGRLEDEDGGW